MVKTPTTNPRKKKTMKLKKRIATFGAALMLLTPLTACAQGVSTEEPEQTATKKVEEAEATPEQLASIITKYGVNWKKVIDAETDCESLQLYAKLDDATSDVKFASILCLEEMKAMTNTTGTAAIKFRELEAPSSMSDLVDDTIKQLDIIAEVDLDTVCGDVPFGDPDCNSQMLPLKIAYMRLADQLNAWSPYL